MFSDMHKSIASVISRNQWQKSADRCWYEVSCTERLQVWQEIKLQTNHEIQSATWQLQLNIILAGVPGVGRPQIK